MLRLRMVILAYFYHKCGTGNTGAAVNITTSKANSIFSVEKDT